MPRFSVLIPSRLEGPRPGALFLESAVASVRAQKLGSPPQILVGLDAGVTPPPGLAERLGVRFINSDGRSQAAALNAAASGIAGDHVALLEKNDWADLSRIVQVSGSRTYCLKGRLALLEGVLMNWALQRIAEADFTPITVPAIAREQA